PGPQHGDALTSHLGKGVGHGSDDTADAGAQDGIGARRRLAVVAAWFQRHVERGISGRLASRRQGMDLRVGLAETLMPALAYRLAGADDNGADERVWLDLATAPFRQLQGTTHPLPLGWVHAFNLTESPSPGRLPEAVF